MVTQGKGFDYTLRVSRAASWRSQTHITLLSLSSLSRGTPSCPTASRHTSRIHGPSQHSRTRGPGPPLSLLDSPCLAIFQSGFKKWTRIRIRRGSPALPQSSTAWLRLCLSTLGPQSGSPHPHFGCHTFSGFKKLLIYFTNRNSNLIPPDSSNCPLDLPTEELNNNSFHPAACCALI